jgi:hypothetical protein
MRRLGLALYVLSSLLVTVAFVWAQAVPPGAAPSCDQQLEMARTENIALRKQLAQNMFQAAFMEEQNQVLRKQVEAQAAKDKAAEKK